MSIIKNPIKQGNLAVAKNALRIPTIVCLCGSTRFYEQFQEANFRETMAGRIVLSVGFYPHSTQKAHGEDIGITKAEKIALDELHKRKIDLADEILVLNVGGYIGDSTRSEIAYAEACGRDIRYLEPESVGEGFRSSLRRYISAMSPAVALEVIALLREAKSDFEDSIKSCWCKGKPCADCFARRDWIQRLAALGGEVP